MNRLVGSVVFACLFAMGYVLVNGLSDSYVLFGAEGILLSGWRILVAGAIFLLGVGAFALALRLAKAAMTALGLVAMTAVAALLWQASQGTQAYNEAKTTVARAAPGESQAEVSCRALDSLMQGLEEDRPEHQVDASGDVFVEAARRSGNAALSTATDALVAAMDRNDEEGFWQALDEVYAACAEVMQGHGDTRA